MHDYALYYLRSSYKNMYYSDMKKLKWSEICKAGEEMNVAYAAQSEAGSWALHGHDFYEVFRVDSGEGTHVCRPASASHSLHTGQMVFVRPGDVHGFRAKAGSEPFALINVAFSAHDWETLQDRYPELAEPFFSISDRTMPMVEPGTETDRTVATMFRRLLVGPRTALRRDSFLLSLFQEVGMEEDSFLPEPMPAWLRQGIMRFTKEDAFPCQNISHLADLSGCSGGHLTRTMRDVLGVTPSEWLKTVRLDRACRLLEGSTYAVSEVAALSGFDNLSHFHRCFRARTGMTPRRYRLAHARSVFG